MKQEMSIKLWIILTFLPFAYHQILPDYMVSECYGSSFNFDCGAGHQIRITKDFFGYNARSQCRSRDASDCRVTNPTSTSLINRFCTGRQSCSYFQVERRGCNGVYTNYQQVEYQCVPGMKSRNICQRFFYQGSGIFVSSPEFPENYPPNLDCSCFVTTNSRSPQSKVNMQVVFMSIRHNAPCDDWLRVGRTLLCGTKVEWFTGKQIPLQFHSDAYGGHRGFWVFFEPSRPSDKIIVRCRNTTLPVLLQNIRRQQSFMRTRVPQNATRSPILTNPITEPTPVTRESVYDASRVSMPTGDNRGSTRSIDRAALNKGDNVNLEEGETGLESDDSPDPGDRSDISEENEEGIRLDSDISTEQEPQYVQTTLPLDTIANIDEVGREAIHSPGFESNDEHKKKMVVNSHEIPGGSSDIPRSSVRRVFHHDPESISPDDYSEPEKPDHFDTENDMDNNISDDITTELNTAHFISNIDDDSRLERPLIHQGRDSQSTDLSDSKLIETVEDTEKSKENTNDLKPTPFDILKYVMEKLKHDHQNENLIDSSQNNVHHEHDNKTSTVSPSPVIPPNGDTLVIQTNQQHNKESNDNTMDNQEPQLAKDDTKDNFEGSNRFSGSDDMPSTTTKYEDVTNKTPARSQTSMDTDQSISDIDATPFHATEHDEINKLDAESDRGDIIAQPHNISQMSKENNMNQDVGLGIPFSESQDKDNDAEIITWDRAPEHSHNEPNSVDPSNDPFQTQDINRKQIKQPPTLIEQVEQEHTSEENTIPKHTPVTISDLNEDSITSPPIVLSPIASDKIEDPLHEDAEIPSLTDYPFPPYIYSDSYEESVYSEPRSELDVTQMNDEIPIELLDTKINSQIHVSPNMDDETEIPSDIKFAKETNVPNLLDFQPNFQDTVDVPTSNAYSDYSVEIVMERSSKDKEGPNPEIMQPNNNEDPINEDRRQFMQEFINSFHRNRNQYYDNPLYPDMDSIRNSGDTFPFDYAPFYTDSYDTMYGGYMRTRFETDSGIFIKPTAKRNSTEPPDVTETSLEINHEINQSDEPSVKESGHERAPYEEKENDENTIILEAEIDNIEIEDSFEKVVISSEASRPQGTNKPYRATTPATLNIKKTNDIHQIENKNAINNKYENNDVVPSVNKDKDVKPSRNPTVTEHLDNSIHPKVLMLDENERVHNVITTSQTSPSNENILSLTETEIDRSEDIIVPEKTAENSYENFVTLSSASDVVIATNNGSDISVVKKKERSGSRENVLTFGLIVAGICLGCAIVLGLCIAVALICRKKKRRVSVAPRPTLAIAHARRELLQTDDTKPTRSSLLNRTDPAANKRSNTKSHDTYARGLGHQSVLDVDNLYAAKPPSQKEKGVQVDIHDRPTEVIMRPLFRIESDSDSDISLCEVHPYSMVNKHSKGVQTLSPYELQQTICSRKKIRGMSPPFTLRRKKIIRPQGSQTVSCGINDLNGNGSGPYSAVNKENAHSYRKQHHEYQPQIHPGQRHVHCASTVNANNKTIMKKMYKPSAISETAASVPERILTSSGQTTFDTSFVDSYYKEPNPDSDVESDWDMQSVLSF